MFICLKRKNILFICGIVIIVGLICFSCIHMAGAVASSNSNVSSAKTIVIDPGHGGVDPGAIGVNGCEEKKINLAISLNLRDILVANGYNVIMTRDDDVSIHDKKYKKISQIKTSDIKNRLKTIESHPDSMAVVIHQNEYTEEKYKGAQMFYGRVNPQSKLLAESIQAAFRNNLQPNNTREIKRCTKDVYLVNNAKNNIVLVECGFLSNYEDATMLCDEEYQQKVAFTIFNGIENYNNGTGE